MTNTNYYFIASPLHLLFSVVKALENKQQRNIAVIDYYLESNRKLFTDVLQQGDIFETVISFDDSHIKSKVTKRKARLKILSELVAQTPPSRIYTGSDRSLEFQYCMHLSNKNGRTVAGEYLDEGTQTYLGHRYMHKFVHLYVEPLLKKLAYGWWWKSPKMIGASGWIKTIHATFPELVHPVLRDNKQKQIKAISHEQFATPEFAAFTNKLMELSDINPVPLQNVDYVILLTGDSFYTDVRAHLNKLLDVLTKKTSKDRIALKPHPRSEHLAEFKREHPELVHIDNRVGFELLLSQFHENCTFIGDVSSTLFTIRWLNQNQKVLAVKLQQKTPDHFVQPLANLLSSVNVPQLSYDELENLL
ncbi:polysialyltransferase family glycosyltransferase [Pseudidiomarina donghaiensis]|uniref:polysialyltransferase family glycosyltransferase n=1 Tax=Pseudidiomarina donghaiensis TaxID=519452 RepID=UPI003A9869B0